MALTLQNLNKNLRMSSKQSLAFALKGQKSMDGIIKKTCKDIENSLTKYVNLFQRPVNGKFCQLFLEFLDMQNSASVLLTSMITKAKITDAF